jgi:hypothetical protein
VNTDIDITSILVYLYTPTSAAVALVINISNSNTSKLNYNIEEIINTNHDISYEIQHLQKLILWAMIPYAVVEIY